MSDHEDETKTEDNSHSKIVPQITIVTNITAKFPYLKKGEYDIWAMKMQNFISSSDLLCWNIVLKGNSAKSMITNQDGNLKIRPPVTAEEHQQARFGGNTESKKMQKSLLKQCVSVSAGDVAAAAVSPQSETEFAFMGLFTEAKWNNSGKNLYKLIDSSMSVRTKRGLGLDKYIREGELGIDDSNVSIFHTTSDDLEGKTIYNRFASAEHMKAVPPPLTENYMPPSNIPDIDESQMVYGKKATDSSEIKTNNDSISYSNDSVLFYFSDSVFAPASESRNTIVIDCASQEDFPSVCTSSIETDVKSSNTLCNKFGSSNKESHFRKHKSVTSKSCYVCGSYLHLIKDCDLHKQRFTKRNAEGKGTLGRRPTRKPVNQNSPKPVFAGRPKPVSAGRPNPVSAGRPNPISADQPNPVSAGQPNIIFAGDGILGPRPLNFQPKSTYFHSFLHNNQQIIFPITHNSLYWLYMTGGLNGKTTVKPSADLLKVCRALTMSARVLNCPDFKLEEIVMALMTCLKLYGVHYQCFTVKCGLLCSCCSTLNPYTALMMIYYWKLDNKQVIIQFREGLLGIVIPAARAFCFCCQKQGDDTAFLLLYMDDIVLTTSSDHLLQQIIASLHREFSMTDLGALNYFLGILVMRDSSGIFLSQRKYAIEILERAHMVGCNPSWTPVDTDSKLGDSGTPVVDPTLYQSLAGSLQYLTFTKPDITYVVQQAGCPTTRWSTSGYCVFLGNNLLSWSSKRQPTLSRSSAEAEYRGVANVVAETCWIRNLLCELHIPLSSANIVYCDNVSVVYLSSNLVQQQCTKHIEIDIHFVQDLVATGQVRVLHVPSRFQYADIFTKGLPSVLIDEFRDSLSVRCTLALTAGEY
nr:ribonuclease H-like domain-containing protein [Tanacetum cinerariifolium]